MSTLEKVRRLEQYLVMNGSKADSVLDLGINKLLAHEQAKILTLKKRLLSQLSEFEKSYSMSNSEFYQRYEQGDMGDDMDFIEWATTIEMLASVEKKLIFLETCTQL